MNEGSHARARARRFGTTVRHKRSFRSYRLDSHSGDAPRRQRVKSVRLRALRVHHPSRSQRRAEVRIHMFRCRRRRGAFPFNFQFRIPFGLPLSHVRRDAAGALAAVARVARSPRRRPRLSAVDGPDGHGVVGWSRQAIAAALRASDRMADVLGEASLLGHLQIGDVQLDAKPVTLAIMSTPPSRMRPFRTTAQCSLILTPSRR